MSPLGGGPRVIDSGTVRSEKEAIAAMGTRQCADCGKSEIFQWREDGPLPADVVYAGRARCSGCHASWSHHFRAGPGWDDQPGPDDPRFATSREPSTIFPEKTFRKWLETHLSWHEDLEAPPADASEDDLFDYQSERTMHVRHALEALLEIEKLRRAEGKALEPTDAKVRASMLAEWVALGHPLPPDIAS